MDLKKIAEKVIKHSSDAYFPTYPCCKQAIEQALKQVREETIDECADACFPCGAIEVEIAARKIRELKGKA